MGRKSVADQRRIEIIQAFYRCVITLGFSRASIRAVAREANVLPSTLHHYFKDRNEMITETVAHFTKQISKGFTPTENGMASEDARLSEGLEYIFGSAMINSEYTGFFLECMAEARHNPEVKDSVARLFARFRENIMEHMGGIAAFKRLNPSKQKMLASMIVALHEGIELQWFADPAAVSLEDAIAFTQTLMEKF
ncbi:MAG: TetR family transcriptional regulator [Desulfobacteraceae bacterium]|nr:TetR family transcriptional regulator [Desulfobacteraceae bacterium]